MRTAASAIAAMELVHTHTSESTDATAGKEAALAWQREMERAQADAWFSGSLPHPARDAIHPDKDGHGPVMSGAPSRNKEPAPRTDVVSEGADASHDKSAQHADGAANSGDSLGIGRGHRRPLESSIGSDPMPQLAPYAALGSVRGGSSAVQHSFPAVPAQPAAMPAIPAVYGAVMVGAAATANVMPAFDHLTEPNDKCGPNLGAMDDTVVAKVTVTPKLGGIGAGEQQPVRVHIEHGETGPTVWLGVDHDSFEQLPALTQAMTRWLAAAGYALPTWICNGQPWQPIAPGKQAQPDESAGTAAPESPISDASQPLYPTPINTGSPK